MKTNSPRWTLVATSFGLGMALLDVTAGNVAVPSIQRDFGTGIAGLSWVIDGYTLAFASALVLAGGLGDRLGTRRVFASGLVLFTVASLLCGVAPTVGLLIAARVLQGLGAALFMPSSLALLARAYPDPGQRARAIGFWSALTAITGGSGPLVGGILTSTLGWRSIFLVNLPLGITGVLMTARFVRPTAPSRARTLDLPAQLVAALSLGSVTWALVERAERGWLPGGARRAPGRRRRTRAVHLDGEHCGRADASAEALPAPHLRDDLGGRASVRRGVLRRPPRALALLPARAGERRRRSRACTSAPSR